MRESGVTEAYVFIFMGQSNMAGRGVASLAPKVAAGQGYEYRAVTAPDALAHLEEPFGAEENNPDGVFEPGMKTGSMASAFVNAAHPLLQKPLVCVSCAKGGSRIDEWQPGTPYYRDALARLEHCRSFLSANGCRIAGAYMLWCQGCTDADNGMPEEEYAEKAERFIRSFLKEGAVERCFLVQIGNHRDRPLLYRPIQDAQERLCAGGGDIVMVSRCLKTMAARGLMKDEYHYLQPAYDEAGTEAGRNAARAILRDGPRGGEGTE